MPPETDYSHYTWKWADGDGDPTMRFISNGLEAPTASKRYDIDPHFDWIPIPIHTGWCNDHALVFAGKECPRCAIAEQTCMWCAKGPFPTVQELEAHEASCEA